MVTTIHARNNLTFTLFTNRKGSVRPETFEQYRQKLSGTSDVKKRLYHRKIHQAGPKTNDEVTEL